MYFSMADQVTNYHVPGSSSYHVPGSSSRPT